MSILPRRPPHLWPWFAWLGLFFGVWSLLAIEHGGLGAVFARWQIAVAMAIGSYFAGSTPMGGGTVGFPILVLLLDEPAQLGRDFSMAVQSIGMVSASIFVLARRQPMALAMLHGALLGATIGVPLGIVFVAPLVPALWIKLVFAVVWGSFGLLHVWRIGEISGHTGMTDFDERWDRRVGFAIGLSAGATVVAVSGVGVDMVLYTVLVLLCRTDLKIAIPTSVVIMAFASVIGIATKALTTGVQQGVYGHWLAAAPVVVLGAPLGALVVAKVGRRATLFAVAVLCVGQLVWTLQDSADALGAAGIAATLGAVAMCLLGFEWLRGYGARLVARNAARRAPRPDGVAAAGGRADGSDAAS